MKKPSNLTALLAGGILLAAGVSQANATVVEITKSDFNDGTIFGMGRTAPAGQGQEDQETEPGTIPGQNWDMEAFLLDTDTMKLYIVAGYDLANGVPYIGGPAPGNADDQITPGDLFIKQGGTQPSGSPTSTGSGNVANSIYGYNFAVDLSLQNPAGPFVPQSFGSTATVYALGANTQLNTALWDQFQGNPWKYANDGTAIGSFTTSISYSTYATDALLNSYLAGLGVNTAGAYQFRGGAHNVLEVDLSFLVPTASGDTWLSYTMECGNDSLKGSIPDSSASALLIVLGLAGMSVAGLKFRRV